MNISLDSPQVRRISDELHQSTTATSDASLWLAVDGSDQRLPDIEGIDWSSRDSVDVRLPHPDIDPQWYPRWFRLQLDKAEDAHILGHSIVWALEETAPERLRAGMGRRVSGWFQMGSGTIEDAARQWGNNMVRRVPQAPGRALLRLHDPAVLWSVWQILGDEQKRQCLGPLRRWHLIDPMGGLLQLEAKDDVGKLDIGSTDLSVAQWQDIQHITPLHQALLQMTSARQPNMAEYEQWFQTGLQALRRAQNSGLADEHSLSLFAQLAMTRHPHFDMHPDLQRILDQREPDEPLGGMLCDFTEADWNRIVSEVGPIATR